MRPDQIQRMQDLSERLVDHFLVEADPGEWPGAGLAPNDMSKDDRGDQFWCKKNAAATLAIIARMQATIAYETTGGRSDLQDEGDLEEEQRAREKEAQKLMREVIGRVGATP